MIRHLLISILPALGLLNAQVVSVPRAVNTLPDLVSLPAVSSLGTVTVRDELAGGQFYLTNTTALTNTGYRIASATAGYSWQRVSKGPFNPYWFGAKGSGAVDDRTSVQNCLDAAYQWTNSVYAPPGQFLILTTNLFLTNNVDIVGSRNSVFLTTETNINIFYGTNLTNVRISGIQLNGPGKGSGSGQKTSGILLENCSRFVIDRVEATSFPWDGIGVSQCNNGRIENNLSKSSRVGINVYRSYNVVVSGNEVDLCGFAGSSGGGILLYCPGDEFGDSYGLTCVGNLAKNNNYHGIFAENITRSTIANNILANNGEGLGSASGLAFHFGDGGTPAAVTISGNVAYLNRDHGIVVQNVYDGTDAATGLSIIGNTCTANQKVGIRIVENVDDSVISGNVCNSNGTGASATGFRNGFMIAAGCNRIVVTGNYARDNPEDGLKITDEDIAACGEILVSGNTFYNNSGYGINLVSSTYTSVAPRIFNNHIRNNTSGSIANAHSFTTLRGNSYSFDRLSGSATLSSGSATVSTSEATTGASILLTTAAAGTGRLTVTAISSGTSFSVTSSDGGDARTFYWQIIH